MLRNCGEHRATGVPTATAASVGDLRGDANMVDVFAPSPIYEQLKQIAREFLLSVRDRDYEHVWNNLITPEARKLLSAALFPIHVYKEGKIDKLLNPLNLVNQTISITRGMALAFQVDAKGIRTGFFDGIATGLERTGWYEFSSEECYAFVDGANTVLLAETPGIPLVMPFVQDLEGKYKVDLEAVAVFSMYVSASTLYKIGVKALELDQPGSALTYFELAASLAKPHQRLRRLVLDNLVAQQLIRDARKKELEEQEKFVLLARDQVLKLLSGPEEVSTPMDMGKFLEETFRGYTEIPNIVLDEQEIACLHNLDDDSLRKAVASILNGVDPVVAQREAEKPHTPAEIADIELPLMIGNELYYLCLAFKSGIEIRTDYVPVDVSYQIIRPFMYFPNCVVVFITAKPCSQYLLNYIKVARATQGWAIEVIQHKELGKLLKASDLLNT